MGKHEDQDYFEFTKNHAGYSLVAKCAAAMKAANFSEVSKADFDEALDSLSHAMAEDQGVSFAEAYGLILGSPLGRQLYEGREQAPYGSAFQVAKHHEMVAKRQQERDAERYAQQTGIPIAKAREMVRKYYEDLK